MKRFALAAVTVVLAVGLCACTSVIRGVGDYIGDTVKDAADSAQEAVDSAQDAVSSALDSIADEQTDENGSATDPGADDGKPAWPDSEAAKQVPQPPFETGEVEMTGADQMTGYYTGLSVDEARAYADELRRAGFTLEETSSNFSFVYMFQAKNDKGWMTMLTYATTDGSVVLLVQKADT